MIDRQDLAKQIYSASYRTGDFVLRSGQISHDYFDKYQFESNPMLLGLIAKAMTKLIPGEIEVLAGLELGGIPLVTALSLTTGIPAGYVRKSAKRYGTCSIVEGGEVRNKNVCVVEDVITTGGQVVKSAEELRKLGATVRSVVCVIVRQKEAAVNLHMAGLNLVGLYTMEQIVAVARGTQSFDLEST